jgi:hypothetical protein
MPSIAAEAFASAGDQRANARHVQRTGDAILGDVDARLERCRRSLLHFALTRAFLGAFFAIQHVGARRVMFAAAHQCQFDLILDVFDMKGAARGLTAHQRVHHVVGKLRHLLAHARGGGPLATIDRDKRFGHGHGDFWRLKAHHRTVAPDHLVLRVGRRAFRRMVRNHGRQH